MVEQVVFRKIILETVHLPRTFQSVDLLTEGSAQGERVTRVAEPDLVPRLMAIPDVRRVVLEELRRPMSATVVCGVQEPFTRTGRKPGDIDVLIVDSQLPQESIAIECKRVKIRVIAEGAHHVNLFEHVLEGVHQANSLREFGFFQTYLCVIAVVDASAQQEWNIPNRGLDPAATHHYGEHKTFARFIAFPGREELHKEIGIILLEVIQPTGRPITELLSLGICVHHPPTPQQQRPDITNKVAAYLQHRSS
jgi:hypothetical protein